MSVFQIKQPSSRHETTWNGAVSSAASVTLGAFGAETFALRLATATPVWFTIGNPPANPSSVSSGSALLPANTIDFVTITPGQSLAFTGSTASAGQFTVTEIS